MGILTLFLKLVWLLFFFYSHVSASKDTKIIPAQSGRNVALTCRAPNNNILVVEWSRADLGDQYVLLNRDDQFVPDNQHQSFKNRVDLQDRQMKDGDVSLILKDVTTADAGTYKCRVAQKSGQPMSLITTINLRVVDPPGQTAGDTEDGGKEDGGKEDGGKEDGGKEAGGKEDGGKEDPVSRGRSGLVAGLSVFGIICGVVAAFLIKLKTRKTEKVILV